MRERPKKTLLPTTVRAGDIVVLGPCPGCELWQVDYSQETAMTYVDLERDSGLLIASANPGWRETVEAVLQEHFNECRHLQLLLERMGALPTEPGPSSTTEQLDAGF